MMPDQDRMIIELLGEISNSLSNIHIELSKIRDTLEK